MQHYNIAFYSDTYLPAVDGVVTSMLDFKKELERRGHNVYIFASCKIRNKKKYETKNIFLYPGLEFKPYPQYSVALFPYYSSLKLKELGIDIVHSQTPFIMGFNSLIAAKLGRYPLIGSFHTMINSKSLSTYYPKNRTLRKIYTRYVWKYTKFFYRRCNVTIAPSEAIARFLKTHEIRNVRVVPNGINTKRFDSRISGEGMRERLKLGSGDEVILYLGRMSKEKRIDILLKACSMIFKKRRNSRLIMGGTGPALEEYKRMARRLGIQSRVKFLGLVDSKVLPEVYAASDLLCLPSTFETQGIVSLEAMAMGKPVVGADYLALKDLIVNGKNGERFRSGDYAACASKIEKVLNSISIYTRDAVSTARSYSIERAADKLLKTYDFVASKQAVY
jgi:1,2-diacylglycerol 3-alpha-glucosyltransferase